MKRVLLGMLLLGLFSALPARAQTPPAGTVHQVVLSWVAPSPVGGSGTVAGYNVYRSSAAANFVKINAALVVGLTMTDTNVVAGTTYAYCATTVDSSQHESACTVPVNAAVPSNPNIPASFVATPN